MIASYSRPEVFTPWHPITPRPLQPIGAPPQVVNIPQLPSPPRQPAFDVPYTLTTHIIPAAYPRSTPDVPLPRIPTEFKSPKERNEQLIAMKDEMAEKHDRARSWQETDVSKKVLWNCVNRYVRKGLNGEKKGGLTLLFAHANGFPKEIWEPVLHHLLSSSHTQQLVDEVWSWESVQHGDAALINAAAVGGSFDWADNTRDILNFLFNYLPGSPSSSPLPTNLQRLSAQEGEPRKTKGIPGRIVLAVGHSYGGCVLAQAALYHPALFSSLMLVDPVVIAPQKRCISDFTSNLALGALRRRVKWTSRDEALRLFRENPFFAAWDPEALKVYAECGLTPDENGGVRLKMSGVDEALMFVNLRAPYEVFHMLDKLDDRIELRWIIPEKGGGMGGPKFTRERVWRRPQNASGVMIPGAGHLIAQEAPRELGQEISKFIQRKYGVLSANL